MPLRLSKFVYRLSSSNSGRVDTILMSLSKAFDYLVYDLMVANLMGWDTLL